MRVIQEGKYTNEDEEDANKPQSLNMFRYIDPLRFLSITKMTILNIFEHYMYMLA